MYVICTWSVRNLYGTCTWSVVPVQLLVGKEGGGESITLISLGRDKALILKFKVLTMDVKIKLLGLWLIIFHIPKIWRLYPFLMNIISLLLWRLYPYLYKDYILTFMKITSLPLWRLHPYLYEDYIPTFINIISLPLLRLYRLPLWRWYPYLYEYYIPTFMNIISLPL